MAYYGDIRLGDTIDVKFCTVQSTGAPTQLAGSPVISAYPANSTTQVTAGITLSVDFDSVTGLNNVRVVASSGNGYATATNYELVITTGTVNSVSAVGYVIGSFSIENRSAVMPTTAARTLDVSTGGEAGVDWANVGSPTTTVGLSGTTVATVTTTTTATNVTTVNGLAANVITATSIAADAIGASELAADAATEIANAVWDTDATGRQTAGTFGQAIGDPGADANTIYGAVVTGATGATIAADIITIDDFLDTEMAATLAAVDTEVASILADTDDIQTRLPAALVGGRMDSSVGAMAANTMTAAASAADLLAEVRAEVVAALSTDTYAEPTGVPAATDDLAAKIGFIYEALRNRIDVTATKLTFYDDANAAQWEKDLSDDGTTYSESEGNAI